jgi:hypothetical protein
VIGTHRVAWLETEVDEWIARACAQRADQGSNLHTPSAGSDKGGAL